MPRPVWLVPVAMGVVIAQTNPTAKREGPYWTEISSGTLNAAPRLKVGARGPVVIRGENRSDILYTVKRRVRARTQAEAERLFESVAVKTKTAGGVCYLVILASNPAQVSSELEIRAPRRLRLVSVENQGGAINGREFDGDFSADTNAGQVILDRIAGSVTARTGGGDVMLGRVGGSARCLSGGGSITVDSVAGESWFESVGGEVRIREAGGPVRASTAGNIVVERAAQSVTAQASGGIIEVRQAGGPVTAEVSDGGIQVASAANIRCELASGAIRLRNVSGALRATTGIGTVLADLLSGAAFQDSILNTGRGDVIVTIPSNASLRIWAQTDPACRGGRIVSDFPEIRPRPAADALCVKPVVAEGSLNGGGPVLRVSAAGGAVYLRRQR